MKGSAILLTALVVQSPFLKYEQDFVRDAAVFHKNVTLNQLTLQFGKPLGEDGYIGVCEEGDRGLLITIDERWWKRSGDDSRRALIYHEMGHCLLDRFHDNRWIKGRPFSIMYPEIVSGSTYRKHWPYYLCDLFRYPVPASFPGGPEGCHKP